MTSYRISTPVPDYTGVVGNCAFANGVYEGPVEPGPLGYFRQAGYTIELLADLPGTLGETGDEKEPAQVPVPAKSASKADWVAYAVIQGMTEAAATKTTRDDLVALYTQGDDQ